MGTSFDFAQEASQNHIITNDRMLTLYEILGVPRNASEEQIKKSFRAQALAFHPDKNPSPEAHKRFHEINHAYQVLSDRDLKAKYDHKLQYNDYFQAAVQQQSKTVRDHKKWNAVFNQVKATQQRYKEQIIRLYPVFVIVNAVCLVISVLFLADSFLPTKTEKDFYVGTSMNPKTDHTGWIELMTTKNHCFYVPGEDMYYFTQDCTVDIHRTQFFNFPKYIEKAGAPELYTYDLPGVYGFILFIPIAMMASTTVWLTRIKNKELSIICGVINSLCALLFAGMINTYS